MLSGPDIAIFNLQINNINISSTCTSKILIGLTTLYASRELKSLVYRATRKEIRKDFFQSQVMDPAQVVYTCQIGIDTQKFQDITKQHVTVPYKQLQQIYEKPEPPESVLRVLPHTLHWNLVSHSASALKLDLYVNQSQI